MALVPRILSVLRRLRARILRRQEDQQLRDLAEVLGEVPLFSTLSRGMRFDLAEAVHERTFKRDEYLYMQGDPGIGAYVIRSGSVRRMVTGSSGQPSQAGIDGPGDIVGTESLVGGGAIRRPESAQAVSDTVALGLFGPELRTVERRHPRTGAAVLGLLAQHLALCLAEVRSELAEKSTAAEAVALIDAASEQATARISQPPETRPS